MAPGLISQQATLLFLVKGRVCLFSNPEPLSETGSTRSSDPVYRPSVQAHLVGSGGSVSSHLQGRPGAAVRNPATIAATAVLSAPRFPCHVTTVLPIYGTP